LPPTPLYGSSLSVYPSLTLHRYFLPLRLTAPTPTLFYTLSLHDALPIFSIFSSLVTRSQDWLPTVQLVLHADWQVLLHSPQPVRSEEHTSELQSRFELVCRLLLEKKKNIKENAEML